MPKYAEHSGCFFEKCARAHVQMEEKAKSSKLLGILQEYLEQEDGLDTGFMHERIQKHRPEVDTEIVNLPVSMPFDRRNMSEVQEILYECFKQEDAQAGWMRECIQKNGPESDAEIGNPCMVVPLDHGNVFEMQEALGKMQVLENHDWNSLIQGYVENGKPHLAIGLYHKMQQDSVPLNRYALQLLLKACHMLDSMELGLEIHTEVTKLTAEKNRFMASALVDMYAKCGFLLEAKCVFNKLDERDTVLWTTLISGYAEKGLFESVLFYFDEMKLEGKSPDAVTFVSFLKACSTSGDFERAQQVHIEITEVGLEGNRFVGSALVYFYIKYGKLLEAGMVFDSLAVRDLVLWNVLIGGYAEKRLGEELLNCLKNMGREGVLPNAVTFINSLKCCDAPQELGMCHNLHGHIMERELERDLVLGGALVDAYSKCRSVAEAQDVFDELPNRTVITWTALVSGYSDQGLEEDALYCLEQMQMNGVPPNDGTYVCCLKACGGIGALDKGREIHAVVACQGFERELPIGNTLVDFYFKCSFIMDARKVFDKLLHRDSVSWNILISKYVEHGFAEDAFQCLEEMREHGVCPDIVSYLSCLKACGSVGAIHGAHSLHTEINQIGFEGDSFIGSTLIDMYSKCGLLAEAHKIFNQIWVQDVVAWNTLLAGYTFLGDNDLVFHLFERMGQNKVLPDATTFLRLLNVCSHVGYVDQGQQYFKFFREKYGIAPATEHYNALIDLLSRAGRLEETLILLERLPFQPNLVTWTTVLGACRKSGDVELGRRAFENAYGLDDEQAASFISMFNIYVESDMWEGAKLIEARWLDMSACIEQELSFILEGKE